MKQGVAGGGSYLILRFVFGLDWWVAFPIAMGNATNHSKPKPKRRTGYDSPPATLCFIIPSSLAGTGGGGPDRDSYLCINSLQATAPWYNYDPTR